MAVTNTNAAFLSVDGTDVSGNWTELSLDWSRESVAADRGSSIDYKQRLAGKKDYKGSVTIVYDTDAIPTEIQAMVDNDDVTIIYGPEGNASGKPKHEQDFIVTGITFKQMTDRSSMLVFQCNIEAANDVVSDYLSGDTFA